MWLLELPAELGYEGGGTGGGIDSGLGWGPEVIGGIVGATAVCRTGFWTWVLFTDFMITGDWEMACLAVHAWRAVGRLDRLALEAELEAHEVWVAHEEALDMEETGDSLLWSCCMLVFRPFKPLSRGSWGVRWVAMPEQHTGWRSRACICVTSKTWWSVTHSGWATIAGSTTGNLRQGRVKGYCEIYSDFGGLRGFSDWFNVNEGLSPP